MKSLLQRTLDNYQPKSMKPLGGGKTGNVVLITYSNGFRAVARIGRPTTSNGKDTQIGLSVEDQPRREAAFYQLAKLLHLDYLVPETILGRTRHGRPISYQAFVEAMRPHDLEPKLDEDIEKEEWRDYARKALRNADSIHWIRSLVLDFVSCQRDRHLNNVGLRAHVESGELRAIPVLWDNGVAFGPALERYRNVPHKMLYPMTVDVSSVLAPLDKLKLSDFKEALHAVTWLEEREQAFKRLRFACEYPYRLPWVRLFEFGRGLGASRYRDFFSRAID